MKKITISAITLFIAMLTQAQETDPQVGANTTNFIPRWNGTALVTGALQDNGKIGLNRAPETLHRFSALRQISTSGFTSTVHSAIKGENNILGTTTTNSVGYLGMNSPQNLYGVSVFPDLAITDIGVLGVKEKNADNGAALYGWNRGGAAYNYAVVGRTIASGGVNYGLLGSAAGTGTENTAVYGRAEGATLNYGLLGSATSKSGQTAYGVYASAAGAGTNYAGFFNGRVNIVGGDEIVTISGVNPYIQMNSSGSPAGYLKAINSSLHLFTNNSGDIVLGTNGAKRMTVTSTGRVLINALSGTGQLNVEGVDETVSIGGTNPLIQMKNGSSGIGYLRAKETVLEVGTNSTNKAGTLSFNTNGVRRMQIDASGRTIIGDAVATAPLNIKGSNETVSIDGTAAYLQMKAAGTNIGYVRAKDGNLQLSTNSTNNGKLQLMTKNLARLWIDNAGNVSISDDGKIKSGYKLSVKGKIVAEEILVQLNADWPDYVFAKDYKLMQLPQLKQYISQNSHLPGVPSAEKMKEGIAVGDMNKVLMQKVEELTLYVLQLSEELESLKKQNK